MRRLLLGLLLSCCYQMVLARSYDDVQTSGYIDIAVYHKFPPYSYLDEQGQPVGVDIELGKKIAAVLQVTPRWFWLDADENVEDDLRNAIWKGRKIDRVKADLMLRVPYDRKFAYAIDGYGLPRNDLVVMFAPYHAEKWTMARDLNKTGTTRNLAIFRFEKIGVEINSLPDFYLLSAFRGSIRDNVMHYSSTPDAITALKNKEVAAVIGMHSQVLWALKDDRKDYDVDDDGLQQMSKLQWDIGMAVQHDFRQLSYKIEAIIEDMVKSGQLQQLFKQHGLDYVIPEFHSQ